MVEKIFLTGKEYQQQLRFRETYFAGFEDGFLFREHSAGGVGTISGKYTMVLPEQQAAHIFKLVRTDESGIYVCILAALGIVLKKYSQQDHIVIDSPLLLTAGDSFIRSTPLCMIVQDGNTLRTSLNNITSTLKEVYTNQAAFVPPTNGEPPLPHSGILLQNPAIHLPGGEVHHDLIITLHHVNGTLTLEASYNEQAFTAPFIRTLFIHMSRIIGYFQLLDTPLQEMAILDDADREKILAGFNNTARMVPADTTVITLFEALAVRTPDAVAVEYGDTRLTYAALNKKANALAHHLVNQYHAGPDDIIGLMAPPSDSWLIGMLGILKAGAAFLPVDTDLPAERKKFLLTDAGVRLLLTDTEAFLQQDYYEEDVLLLDSVLQQLPEEAPELHRDNTNSLAYVIYTSGTTGFPKGVLLEHGGLVNMVLDQVKQFDIRPSDKVLQFSSVSFDAAVSEICTAICSGAQLVITDRTIIKDETLFLDMLKEKSITVLTLPPSYLSVIPWNQFTFLRVIISAGEKLHTAAALHLSRHVHFYNAYGPTECTVCATINKITPDMTSEDAESIGIPIANMQVYILGAEMELLPPGITGNIYIGGAGVARGYLHLPALNNEKFIPHPFSKVTGAKLYQTGDMGKWLPDGKIVFTGRHDDQVKVRGFRIELSEIAATVMQSRQVKHCEMLIREDTSGGKKLIAFVIPDGNFDQTKVAAYLLARLPQYMLPAVWVCIDALPLTNNGKVDKKKLLEMEKLPAKKDDYTPPENETEMKLAAIWEEVLELEQVSVTDDFFHIGGDSLQAIRVAAAVRETFSQGISINELFRYTTIRQLADYITGVAAGTDKDMEEMPVNQIVAVSRNEAAGLPASFGQERLWMVHQLMGSIQYHLPVILRLKGRVDVAHPEQAIRTIVDRHEVLRTVFNEKNGTVYQQVLPSGEWHFDFVGDIKGDAALKDFIAGYVHRPFNLAEGYMLRAALLKVTAAEHLLIVVMHHIAADGWSVPILVKEFMAAYQAFKSGSYPTLRALSVQYADYAVWQRNSQEQFRQQLEYWEQRLAGMQQLELPTDYPRPVTLQTAGRVFTCRMENNLKKKLDQLSEQQGVTLFMTLLSVFKVLLFRYSGQEDLSAGIAVAGRSQRVTEELVGFFVNMLVMRTTLKENFPFTTLLQQVKQHTLEAYAHQDIPFELVAERLNTVRDNSRHPLFQAAFVLQNLPETPDIELDGLQVQLEEPEFTAAKFDISFEITANSHVFDLRIAYSTLLFSEATIHRLAGHYERLLQSVILSPEEQIGKLNMLQEEEQRQLLQTFNHTSHPFPADQTITGLIAAQAAKTPEAVALVFKDKHFTFKEINERANRLAAYLRAHYVIMPDDLVAVQLERSEWLIIALLAALKTGAAYVPVDPGFPATRTAHIIKESQCKVLLNDDLIQHFAAAEMNYDGSNLPLFQTPDHLMYVIYTSGSTGTPKGVMVEHRSVVNRLVWMWEQYGFTAGDIILQKTNFTFDVSVWEIFMPLCMGARMVLCEPDDVHSPQRIQALIASQQVSCLHFVSGMLDAFMNALFKTGTPAALRSLRLVITSGEVLRPDTVHNWYRCMQVPLHNLYGPTEAAVDVTFYPAAPTDEQIPIGRPVWNTRILILGPADGSLPVGGTGEICIEGVGVARGYLNNQALTASKFTDNPYHAGTIMYRTGDYGKWLPDGNIVYLGRRDGQVKIRGYRIETGEVAAAIHALEYVQACVVVPRQDVYGQSELIAYIVSQQVLDTTLLRTDLAAVLPVYMLPAHYVQLEQLPVSSSGKTDRRNLPDPAGISISGKVAYTAPSGTTEQKLVQIWQNVLGIAIVGTQDNFFELGGNSIKLIRMVGLVNQTLGGSLAVVDAFKLPTIKDIALFLEDGNDVASMEMAATADEGVDVMRNTIHLLNKYHDEE